MFETSIIATPAMYRIVPVFIGLGVPVRPLGLNR